MDFSQVKDVDSFELIPGGTLVEVILGPVVAKPGKDNPNNLVVHLPMQVAKGEHIYVKMDDYAVVKGDSQKAVEMGMGKIKRILEYACGADDSNKAGYIIPEFTNQYGQSEAKWSFLDGKRALVKTKLDSFISNKDPRKLLYSNKVDSYGSKRPTSGGYKLHEAFAKGEQPWQQPLPDMNAAASKISGFSNNNSNDDMPSSLPAEAYAGL